MRVEVKTEILQWACDRAGFDHDALSKKFPRLSAWESGEEKPTLRQLENFAKTVHAPIGFFFLSEPPIERVPIPDLRTVANERKGRPSPDFLDTLYICQQRQEWYRDFARTVGDIPLGFVGSAHLNDDIVRIASKIRDVLGFNLEERRTLPTWTEALRRFIELADKCGVLVMVSGVVGSNNRRKLDTSEFRGFALCDNLAPLIFINGSDSKSAQMFTLAHELAHIWLGESAVSDIEASSAPDNKIELWCNQVAAELLVPLDDFRDEYNKNTDLNVELSRLAKRYKVSTLVILRRIHDAGGLNARQFWTAYQKEVERLQALPGGSGGNFYRTLGSRVGKRFARALVVSTLEGRSSYTEAFRLLGFKKMSTFNDLGHSLGVLI